MPVWLAIVEERPAVCLLVARLGALGTERTGRMGTEEMAYWARDAFVEMPGFTWAPAETTAS